MRPAAPNDPALAYTHRFVRSALPPDARRLLEIGCGNGMLAARLAADGFEVVAIDADADCVAAARGRGVDARLAEWPGFEDGAFDGLLFTRSLHHVHALEAGVAAASASLAPGGCVIVEDFDFGFCDQPSLGWFAGLVRVLAEAGLDVSESAFLTALAEGERAPLEIWRGEHDHDLHPAASIEAVLRRSGASVSAEPAAYFFRYVASLAGAPPAVVEALLDHEEALIRSGAIAPLGRRWVARPPR